MTLSLNFGTDYASARALFLEACRQRGLSVQSRQHPDAKGPIGEDLFMDVARIGPENADGVLFITSATHGTEGITGSGVQMATLKSTLAEELPNGVALVFVHAINPYGFAHLSRTNEDNIDLNRNFVDFSAPLPENDPYDTIHPFIVPADWQGPEREAAEREIKSYIDRHGEKKLQAVLLEGQYTQPDGLFYGGASPSWSNRQWTEIVAAEGKGARHLAILDVHTGIGPKGYGEPIYVGVDSGFGRARSWFGDDVTNAGKGKSHASEFKGPMVSALWDKHPNAEHTAIVLEFGTRPLTQVLSALRADNWLRFHPDVDKNQHRKIKQDLRDALYVDNEDWRLQIWQRSRQLIERGLAGLANTIK